MRDVVREALCAIAGRFSDDAPSIDEAVLLERYAAFEAWPADARLGLLVLAWVLGPGFSLPDFKRAVNRLVPNFEAAARSIGSGQTPVAITLSGIARCAFRNAAVVVRWNLDPETLYWPLDLSQCANPTGATVQPRRTP